MNATVALRYFLNRIYFSIILRTVSQLENFELPTLPTQGNETYPLDMEYTLS